MVQEIISQYEKLVNNNFPLCNEFRAEHISAAERQILMTKIPMSQTATTANIINSSTYL